MPRNMSTGVYTLPAGTGGLPQQPISSAMFNAFVGDIAQDLNANRPVSNGGTGASNPTQARENLGVAIGSNVQAYDAGLQSISGLVTAADMMIYATASDVWATTALTPFGRILIASGGAVDARATLGLGALSIYNFVNDANWSGADLSIANGGTGASSAPAARDNLGITGLLAQKLDTAGGTMSGLLSANGNLSITNSSPAITLHSPNVKLVNIVIDGSGNFLITDLDGAAIFAILPNKTVASAGDVRAAGNFQAGNGSAVYYTDGNIVGSVWGNWGDTGAFAAIGNRIEARVAAAIAAIMPTIAAQGVGAVGTYASLYYGAAISPGTLYNGTSLLWAGNKGLGSAVGYGVWMAEGYTSGDGVTTFKRIS